MAKLYALQTWENFCVGQIQMDGLQETAEQRIMILAEWANFVEAIWPKYLQVGLNTVANSMGFPPVKLTKEEFENLPASHMDNMAEVRLFDDFTRHDFVI